MTTFDDDDDDLRYFEPDDEIERARQELCEAMVEKSKLGVVETERHKIALANYLRLLGYES